MKKIIILSLVLLSCSPTVSTDKDTTVYKYEVGEMCKLKIDSYGDFFNISVLTAVNINPIKQIILLLFVITLIIIYNKKNTGNADTVHAKKFNCKSFINITI